jgi:hypothetical protein
MPVLKGSISGSIKSTAYNIPCRIKSIGLFNRSGGAIVVNLGVVASGVDTYFKSSNLAAVGSAGSSELTLTDITVLANWQILVSTNGLCDYVISIE